MLREDIAKAVAIAKGVIINPSETFRNIEAKKEYEYSVYFLFLLSSIIPFFKSFHEKRQYVNFFASDAINLLLSFLNIPQLRWLISFMCFILLISLAGIACQKLLNECDRRKLKISLLAISGIGVFFQLILITVPLLLQFEHVLLLRRGAVIWTIFLSIIAIRNVQNASWLKSIVIYIISGLPVALIIGITGVAPFLLFLP